MQKEFVKLSVNDIHPYPNNPRINDEAVAYVVESMNQTGNLDPIEVDENNVILSGHTRLLALEQLGVTETECVRYTGLTEEQKKKYRILANQTQSIAEWDFEKLREELDGLNFGDFDFGFEEEETEIDESDLDDENEKDCTTVTLRFESATDYQIVEEKLKNIAEEGNARISVKME